MPSIWIETDWREIKKRRDAYRKKLLDKGVRDGSTKMLKLMARKGL